MKRHVIALIAAFSMLSPFFALVRPAKACGVKMPETLLSLYQASDGVYSGKYAGNDEGKERLDTESFSIADLNKHFDIKTVLKGKPVKELTVTENRYIFKSRQTGFETVEQVDNAQRVDDVTIEEIEEEQRSLALKPGDDILLFVRASEDGKSLILTDYSDGLKKMPVADIAVYEARIRELSTIFAKDKPNPEQVVDWLVRCAQDPVTRWEGVYELQRSFNMLEYEQGRAAERKAKIAKGEPVEDEDKDSGDELDGRSVVFARLLNDYQKQTLTNIVLNSEFQRAPKTKDDDGSVRGDSELMRLVSRWGDSRLAGFYLDQLRGGSLSTGDNSQVMETIATIINDKKLESIAEKFSGISYQRDDNEIDDSDLEDLNDESEDVDEDTTTDESTITVDEPVIEGLTDTTIELETEPAVEESSDAPAKDAKAVETVKKPSILYKQVRADMIAKFILRVDEITGNPEARIAVKN